MGNTHVEVTFRPSGRTVKVKPGTTLLAAARRAGVSIRTRCGGNAACLMCKVKVQPDGALSPISDKEQLKLAGLTDERMRLSCQAKVYGRVEAEVPPDPLQEVVRRRLLQQAEEENDTLW
ncbi:2Fe-2S iron-sulfur cluster-binding protein [Paenibacillus thailandensis]|uniref:2Fe-2S iron-sulfur cluster-binding protein n=1 Tax=Paenibacillus thailandensis TaxID=393250 RepID=A0ABW5QZL7_9BACL